MFRFLKDFSLHFIRLVQKFRIDKEIQINENQIKSFQVYMNKFIRKRFEQDFYQEQEKEEPEEQEDEKTKVDTEMQDEYRYSCMIGFI